MWTSGMTKQGKITTYILAHKRQYISFDIVKKTRDILRRKGETEVPVSIHVDLFCEISDGNLRIGKKRKKKIQNEVVGCEKE